MTSLGANLPLASVSRCFSSCHCRVVSLLSLGGVPFVAAKRFSPFCPWEALPFLSLRGPFLVVFSRCFSSCHCRVPSLLSLGGVPFVAARRFSPFCPWEGSPSVSLPVLWCLWEALPLMSLRGSLLIVFGSRFPSHYSEGPCCLWEGSPLMPFGGSLHLAFAKPSSPHRCEAFFPLSLRGISPLIVARHFPPRPCEIFLFS